MNSDYKNLMHKIFAYAVDSKNKDKYERNHGIEFKLRKRIAWRNDCHDGLNKYIEGDITHILVNGPLDMMCYVDNAFYITNNGDRVMAPYIIGRLIVNEDNVSLHTLNQVYINLEPHK